MASLERRRWGGDPAGTTRAARRPCDYEVYLPDPLVGRAIRLDGTVAAEVAEAETALARLNASVATLVDTEALARLLLRAESAASSRIEGLEVGARRLLRADAARRAGAVSRDVTAAEVLNNVDAMVWAVDAVGAGGAITVDVLLEVHRRLLAGTRLAPHAGLIRTVQNWIGGSGHHPCGAAFVPPPPERVADLLEDLCAFCDDDALSPVAQAAVAHLQFETIHPFVDGNGRAGRALIHLVLRRRGLAPRLLPPISLVLASWSSDYVAGLTAARHVGPPDAPAAQRGLDRWIALFAAACGRAVADARRFEERIGELRRGWGARLGPVRRGSAAALLLAVLPAAPVLTARTASELVGRSFQATNEAIDRLVAAGILTQITIGRRNRAFEAPEVIDAFTDLERRLADPSASSRAPG